MGFFSALLKELFITPESIGKQGENLTASKLGWVNLWGYHGMMLQNVYIPKRNGETTEIDLLYITEKGIFVIESKNYSGYIFGSETNRSWTSTYYAGKTFIEKDICTLMFTAAPFTIGKTRKQPKCPCTQWNTTQP